MYDSEKGKRFALIAAVCFGIAVVYCSISPGLVILKVEDFSSSIPFLVDWIGLFTFAASALFRFEKGIVAAAIIEALLNAFYIVTYFNGNTIDTFPYYLINQVFIVLAYLALALVFMSKIQGSKLAETAWFVPAGIMAVGCMFNWWYVFTNGGFPDEILIRNVIFGAQTLDDLIKVVGVFCMGGWLMERIILAPEIAAIGTVTTYHPKA